MLQQYKTSLLKLITSNGFMKTHTLLSWCSRPYSEKTIVIINYIKIKLEALLGWRFMISKLLMLWNVHLVA